MPYRVTEQGSSTITFGTNLTAELLAYWVDKLPKNATVTVSLQTGDRPGEATTTTLTATWTITPS